MNWRYDIYWDFYFNQTANGSFKLSVYDEMKSLFHRFSSTVSDLRQQHWGFFFSLKKKKIVNTLCSTFHNALRCICSYLFIQFQEPNILLAWVLYNLLFLIIYKKLEHSIVQGSLVFEEKDGIKLEHLDHFLGQKWGMECWKQLFEHNSNSDGRMNWKTLSCYVMWL